MRSERGCLRCGMKRSTPDRCRRTGLTSCCGAKTRRRFSWTNSRGLIPLVLKIDAHLIRHLAVDCENHIGLASGMKALRQRQVHLIETGKLSLGTSEQHIDTLAADRCSDVGERTSSLDSRSEKLQE